MSSLIKLLSNIVDYAGLFPPASLDLRSVVRNYDDYRLASNHWMLARIIIPAARLPEFAQMGAEEIDLPSTQANPWLVSALLPRPNQEQFDQGLLAIEEFNAAQGAGRFRAIVDSVEVATASADSLGEFLPRIPTDIAVFLEIPHQDPTAHFRKLAEFSAHRDKLFAKIRTGGVQPEMIPTVQQVADFLISAAAHGVGLKATAGLHHPVRREYPLTYEATAPRAVMHGFLNVFLAACLAFHRKLDRPQMIEIIEETDPAAFQFDAESARWRDHQISGFEIQQTRKRFAISFGSCSFVEPLEDLAQLNLLQKQTQ